MVTVLEAVRVPEPQVALHPDQAAHSLQTQLVAPKGMLGVTAVVVVLQRPQLFMQLGAAMYAAVGQRPFEASVGHEMALPSDQV